VVDLLLQIQALIPVAFLAIPADTFFSACWAALLCGLGLGLLTGGGHDAPD
jgi:hypothetical protein